MARNQHRTRKHRVNANNNNINNEQEMSDMGGTDTAGSSVTYSNKGSLNWTSDLNQPGTSFNGTMSLGSVDDHLEDDESEQSSARSQPAPSSKPECIRSQRPQSATFRTSSSAEFA